MHPSPKQGRGKRRVAVAFSPGITSVRNASSRRDNSPMSSWKTGLQTAYTSSSPWNRSWTVAKVPSPVTRTPAQENDTKADHREERNSITCQMLSQTRSGHAFAPGRPRSKSRRAAEGRPERGPLWILRGRSSSASPFSAVATGLGEGELFSGCGSRSQSAARVRAGRDQAGEVVVTEDIPRETGTLQGHTGDTRTQAGRIL